MGQIRITGGTHRSRRVTVEDQKGLRPTADRTREVLFNWLGQNLSGMEVLDLYSGSGILAFEAASRSAKWLTCIDNNSKTTNQLRQNLAQLKFQNFTVDQQAASSFVRQCKRTFDLIFLDPPFDSNELNTISAIIAPLVSSSGLVYREYAISQEIEPFDVNLWTMLKQKDAGQVRFELWQKI